MKKSQHTFLCILSGLLTGCWAPYFLLLALMLPSNLYTSVVLAFVGFCLAGILLGLLWRVCLRTGPWRRRALVIQLVCALAAGGILVYRTGLLLASAYPSP